MTGCTLGNAVICGLDRMQAPNAEVPASWPHPSYCPVRLPIRARLERANRRILDWAGPWQVYPDSAGTRPLLANQFRRDSSPGMIRAGCLDLESRKDLIEHRCHATFADFKAAILTILREDAPRKWDTYCDQVTDNFRIISPKDFRVLTWRGI